MASPETTTENTARRIQVFLLTVRHLPDVRRTVHAGDLPRRNPPNPVIDDEARSARHNAVTELRE
jgi:hypothetical protein